MDDEKEEDDDYYDEEDTDNKDIYEAERQSNPALIITNVNLKPKTEPSQTKPVVVPEESSH